MFSFGGTMNVSGDMDNPCSMLSHDMSQFVPFPEGSSDEKCRVCGKNAAGNHYSVPACHGCKSFFRRAIVHNTTYIPCKYDKTCYLNPFEAGRPRKCRNCRLQKCYAVGMVALVPVQRKTRAKSSDSELPDLKLSPVSSPTASPIASPVSSEISTREDYVMGVIDKLLHLDIQIDKFRKSAYNPIIIPSLEGILATTGRLDLADKHGPMHGWPITQDNFIEQQVILNQIKCEPNADAANAPLGTSVGINTKDWLGFDMMTAVEYAKAFPFFHELDSIDKLLLTKATTFMNLSLTSYYHSFLDKMAILQMPDGICISGPAGQDERAVRAFERRLSLRVMGPLIRNVFDKTEYVLLKAIILCNSAVVDLSQTAQSILLRERHNFTAALLLYCLSRYGSNGGPARYYSIINMVDVLEHHQRDFRDFMLLLDISAPKRYADHRKTLQNEILNM